MKLVDKDTVRQNILGSISNQMQNAGISTPNISKSSHFYMAADAVGTVLTGLQADVADNLDQSDITKASGQTLDAIGQTIQFADGSYLVRKQPSPSIGYIQLNAIPNQSVYIDKTYQLTDSSGRVYQVMQAGYYIVAGSATSPVQPLIQIQSTQTGQNQNLPPGSILKWRQVPVFANPTCSTFDTIKGGSAVEDDNSFRNRILAAKSYAPPGSALDIASSFNNLTPYSDYIYVYPCFQGPSTCAIVGTASPAASLNRSRTLEAQAINILYQTAQTKLPQIAQFFVEPTADNLLDIAFLIDTNSWVDQYTLPAVDVNNFRPITITNQPGTGRVIGFTSPYDLRLFAPQTNSGINIQWICIQDFSIVNSQITSYTTNGGGPFEITANINNPLVTGNGYHVWEGDYIMPANTNTQNYLRSVLNSFAQLGPGEIYSPAGTGGGVDVSITTRTQRVPNYAKTQDCRITQSFMSDLLTQNPDIANVGGSPYIYDWTLDAWAGTGNGQIQLNTPPISAIVVGNTTTSPNIFIPECIAFYPINTIQS